MLLVLYGTTANVGKYSRDYFVNKGFSLVMGFCIFGRKDL